jgi:hypothetical protein
MKTYNKLIILALTILMVNACKQEYIDDISTVAPGTDETAPAITIKYPVEGTSVDVPELIASINIEFEVTDDIELKSISVLMDDTEITSYTSFKDYRRFLGEYLYTELTSGAHKLSIVATDMENKSTTADVNFEKKPPYVAKYAGETFYMPFDGDYMEKISFVPATVVGNPGFAGTSLLGLDAYKGAADSYLTFPIDGLTGSEFSAAFWYRVDASPDRSGILNVSPEGEDRTKGFRLFREGSANEQRIKLNVGTGAGETWNDGDVLVAPGTEWVHIAMTISGTTCDIYFNGSLVSSVANTGIDWTDCSVLGIGSGAPNFTYWGHNSDISYYDELRLFNKALSQTEIQTIIEDDNPYVPKYDGEVFYMPFEGKYLDKVSGTEATEVGIPSFAAGKVGQAYAGATDAYLTFPTDGITGASYSAAFWYKVNSTPDRSGILNASLPGEDRTKGFRLFREGNASMQRIKINVGTGSEEVWNDGQEIDATSGDWVHIAFTVSSDKCIIYIDGSLAAEVASAEIDWTGCDNLTIGSGAPNFNYWGHDADLSLYDELRIFNKALSQAEIQTIIDNENTK